MRKITIPILVFILIVGTTIIPVAIVSADGKNWPGDDWTDGPGNMTRWDRNDINYSKYKEDTGLIPTSNNRYQEPPKTDLSVFLSFWSKDKEGADPPQQNYSNKALDTWLKNQGYPYTNDTQNGSVRFNQIAQFELLNLTDVSYTDLADGEFSARTGSYAYTHEDTDRFDRGPNKEISYVPHDEEVREGGCIYFEGDPSTHDYNDNSHCFVEGAFVDEVTIESLVYYHTSGDTVERHISYPSDPNTVEQQEARAIVDYRVNDTEKGYPNSRSEAKEVNDSGTVKKVWYTNPQATIVGTRVIDYDDCSGWDDTGDDCEYGRNSTSEAAFPQRAYHPTIGFNTNESTLGPGEANPRDLDYQTKIQVTYTKHTRKCEMTDDTDDDDNDGDSDPPYDGFDDADGDGIPDVDDDCPNQEEDYDGTEDNDGCPESWDEDPDGDGKINRYDDCDNEDENYNGYQDGDGCYDTEPDPPSSGGGGGGGGGTDCSSPPFPVSCFTGTIGGWLFDLFTPVLSIFSSTVDTASALDCSDAWPRPGPDNPDEQTGDNTDYDDQHYVENTYTETVTESFKVQDRTNIHLNHIDQDGTATRYVVYPDNRMGVLVKTDGDPWNQLKIADTRFGVRTGMRYFYARNDGYDYMIRHNSSHTDNKERYGLGLYPVQPHAFASARGPFVAPPRNASSSGLMEVLAYSPSDRTPPDLEAADSRYEFSTAVDEEYSNAETIVFTFNNTYFRNNGETNLLGQQWIRIYGLTPKQTYLSDMPVDTGTDTCVSLGTSSSNTYCQVMNATNITVNQLEKGENETKVEIILKDNSTGEPIDLEYWKNEGSCTSSSDPPVADDSFAGATGIGKIIIRDNNEVVYTNETGKVVTNISNENITGTNIDARFQPREWYTMDPCYPLYEESATFNPNKEELFDGWVGDIITLMIVFAIVGMFVNFIFKIVGKDKRFMEYFREETLDVLKEIFR